jgi:hypothetical protein
MTGKGLIWFILLAAKRLFTGQFDEISRLHGKNRE